MRSEILSTVFSMSCLAACGQQTEQQQSFKTITTKKENIMKVEIWSDIMCPFCYIGKRNFEMALSQFANKGFVEVEWKSFQLDPTLPEVPKYQDDMYMFVVDRKGFSYEQSKKMHQDLVQYANSVGLEYNFEKALVTNSLKSHRLIQFAKTKGLGEKAEERLFCAYFTQGKNLADEAILIELGKDIGLTEADVNEALTNSIYQDKAEQDARDAQNLGARGVPFFVFNRRYAISGAQPPDQLLQMLKKSFEEWQKESTSSQLIMTQGVVCTPGGECK